MHTANEKERAGFCDPEWYFLGEFPLNELMAEVECWNLPMAGALVQATQDLDIETQLLINIERKLVGFAKDMMARLNQRRPQPMATIRLFCQKKTIGDVPSRKNSNQYSAEQIIKSARIIHQSNPEINGGWGYFLIERGGRCLPGSSASVNNWVDLYLYKEGE